MRSLMRKPPATTKWTSFLCIFWQAVRSEVRDICWHFGPLQSAKKKTAQLARRQSSVQVGLSANAFQVMIKMMLPSLTGRSARWGSVRGEPQYQKKMGSRPSAGGWLHFQSCRRASSTGQGCASFVDDRTKAQFEKLARKSSSGDRSEVAPFSSTCRK